MQVAKPKYELFVDGASRGNPGKAGAGICLKKNNEVMLREGFSLGTATNNTAEYTALILGLFLISNMKQGAPSETEQLEIFSDSQLLVRQIQNLYKVTKPHIRCLKNAVDELLENRSYNIHHIKRDKNETADQLANYGIDQKRAVPKEFLKFMAQHNVHLG